MPKKSSSGPSVTPAFNPNTPVFVQRYTVIVPAKVSAVRVARSPAPRHDGQAHVYLIVDGSPMYIECEKFDEALTLAREIFAVVFPGVPFG
jgi:hypothetical protein